MEKRVLIESIEKKIDDLVAIPFNIDRFLARGKQQEWTTTSQHYFDRDGDIVLNGNEESSIDASIRRALGHHSVNPNDVQRSLLLKESYVQCSDKRFSDCVNHSDESEMMLFTNLVIRARRARKHDETEEQDASLLDRLLLIGDRGAGKTNFLKYFFTSILNHNLLFFNLVL